MISITRALTFEQYAASNRLTLKHGTLRRKLTYFAYLRVLPIVSLIGLPFAVWTTVYFWRAAGNHASSFGLSCGLTAYCAYLVLYPWLFRRKMRKMYNEQELNLPWTIEISDDGIYAVSSGRFETRLDWAYFNSFVETNEMFTLLQTKRLLFLSIAKESLGAEQEQELRSALVKRLSKV